MFMVPIKHYLAHFECLQSLDDTSWMHPAQMISKRASNALIILQHVCWLVVYLPL